MPKDTKKISEKLPEAAIVKAAKKSNRYEALVEKIFRDHYREGMTEIPFHRSDLKTGATALGIQLPDNLGDVLYSFRFRTVLPKAITSSAPKGKEWAIEIAGRSQYKFVLVQTNRIVPNTALVTIKVPDATPEIIAAYAQGDEQALLAKVRYNRLIDVFLGVTAYSLQNHLRTTVVGGGQLEIDEIYVGLDRDGRQFIIPVQAKGGDDQLSVVQTKQDIACCAQKFPMLICRTVSTQFMADKRIAMFELTIEDGMVRVVQEKHYKLVPSDQISLDDLAAYAQRA